MELMRSLWGGGGRGGTHLEVGVELVPGGRLACERKREGRIVLVNGGEVRGVAGWGDLR
jgi:hypothetical protein